MKSAYFATAGNSPCGFHSLAANGCDCIVHIHTRAGMVGNDSDTISDSQGRAVLGQKVPVLLARADESNLRPPDNLAKSSIFERAVARQGLRARVYDDLAVRSYADDGR